MDDEMQGRKNTDITHMTRCRVNRKAVGEELSAREFYTQGLMNTTQALTH